MGEGQGTAGSAGKPVTLFWLSKGARRYCLWCGGGRVVIPPQHDTTRVGGESM